MASTRDTRWLPRALPSVGVPVLLGRGEIDRAFPLRLANKLAALIPDSRVVTVPDAATFVAIDAPGALVDAIIDFVPARGL